METTSHPPCCDHLNAARFEAATGDVRCDRCGEVWVSKTSVQARNHKVARCIFQLLGTLIGGSKAPPGKG